MAARAFKIKPVLWLGAAVAALVTLLTLGTLVAVAWRAEGVSGLGAADWAAVRFTVTQATISAVISVVLAIPVARALARRSFFGRTALITLLGAPFILPVIVAVLGVLAVFGRNGLANVVLGLAGIEPVSIYGLQGVVLIHVFFNLPLATRLILQGWLSIPAERLRLAASLGFGPSDIARTLERPMLREVVPGAFMVIFLICTTSFAVALAVGGGPKATTVELAIYQAFRFDFDLGKAALLACVQFTICALAAGIARWVSVPATLGGGLDRKVERWDANLWRLKLLDFGALACVTLFLLTPLAMIVISGLPGIFDLPPSVLPAAIRSVLIALFSAGLTLVMALSLSILASRCRGKSIASGLVEGVSYLSIAASPLVIGTGLYIVIFPVANPVSLALPITALVNATMSLPFAVRAILPELNQIEDRYGALADSLGMTGWARLRHLLIPRLRRPLGFAAGLAAALSMGDLGVIALFADPSSATLPLALYRLMASYRMADAAGAALLLLGLSLALFWVFDRGGRVDADV